MLAENLRITSGQSAPFGRGGDFYEVAVDGRGCVSIILTDVCGNGPAAGAFVPELRDVVRWHLARARSPGVVLAALNQWLASAAARDGLLRDGPRRARRPALGQSGDRQRRSPRSGREERARRRARVPAGDWGRARHLPGTALSGDRRQARARRPIDPGHRRGDGRARDRRRCPRRARPGRAAPPRVTRRRQGDLRDAASPCTGVRRRDRHRRRTRVEHGRRRRVGPGPAPRAVVDDIDLGQLRRARMGRFS